MHNPEQDPERRVIPATPFEAAIRHMAAETASEKAKVEVEYSTQFHNIPDPFPPLPPNGDRSYLPKRERTIEPIPSFEALVEREGADFEDLPTNPPIENILYRPNLIPIPVPEGMQLDPALRFTYRAVPAETWVVKDSGERQQFESGMVRDTTNGKKKYHLALDGPMYGRWVQQLTLGAEKYAERNWMKANGPEEHQRFKESALRHFMQWYNGEGGEDHAAAVFFNINGAEYTKGKVNGIQRTQQHVGDSGGAA